MILKMDKIRIDSLKRERTDASYDLLAAGRALFSAEKIHA
jgi:hypothetical protein